MKKHLICCLVFVSLFCVCCTKTFYLINNSFQSQPVKIDYDNCLNSSHRNSSLKHYEKKRVVNNIIVQSFDSGCSFEFELVSQKILTLNPLLSRSGSLNMSKEKRLVCIYTYNTEDSSVFTLDTILYRRGNKIITNKFQLSDRILSFIGRSKYVYRID